MKLIDIKNLIDAELDAAVARCEGFTPTIEGDEVWLYPMESTMPLSYTPSSTCSGNRVICQQFHPSRSWVDGGSIMDNINIDFNWIDERCTAHIWIDGSSISCSGPTMLIAAMRCYVAACHAI